MKSSNRLQNKQKQIIGCLQQYLPNGITLYQALLSQVSSKQEYSLTKDDLITLTHYCYMVLGDCVPDGWSVGFHRGLSRKGIADYMLRKITYSVDFIGSTPNESWVRTIVHEVAHILTGIGHGHDNDWKSIMVTLGISNPTYATDSSTEKWARELRERKAKWVGWCPTCGKYSYYLRKPQGVDGGRFCTETEECQERLAYLQQLAESEGTWSVPVQELVKTYSMKIEKVG